MAVLAGQGQPRRLGLTHAPDADHKQLIFVKLTDSALEALSTYIRNNKNNCNGNKPTIQLSKHSGTFAVPVVDEAGNGGLRQFTFSLSSIEDQNGAQGSFECLQSKRHNSLESLGPIRDKVQVQATNDAYTRFGERMSDVKKENEKRTTRYIDRTGNSGLVNSNKIVSRKQILANKSSNFSTGRANDFHRFSVTHGPTGSSRPQPPASSSLLPGSHPMLDRNSAKHKRAPVNSEIMKRPLRERIVHLLAVRPYKKPELIDRLNRDGVREKEKKDIFTLVKQVSIMKDNTYHLSRHIWNDVSEDWKFYTEEERQAFRRRKPQNLTPPGSDGSTGSHASGHSSSSSHPASPQPLQPQKRPLGDASPGSQDVLAKKKRVSNYVRPGSGLSPMGQSPLHLGSETGESKTNAWLKTTENFGKSEPPGSSSSSSPVDSDLKAKFVRITNDDQRRVYKADFNKDYKRYMALHAHLNRVSQRFVRLQQKLNHTSDTSPEYQRLKNTIVQEYQTTNDSQFRRDQEEFQYLHKKLSHIKSLVHDYDTRQISDTKKNSQIPVAASS